MGEYDRVAKILKWNSRIKIFIKAQMILTGKTENSIHNLEDKFEVPSWVQVKDPIDIKREREKQHYTYEEFIKWREYLQWTEISQKLTSLLSIFFGGWGEEESDIVLNMYMWTKF